MALILLLSINMFNYIDRQVLAAVVPAIEKDPAFTDTLNSELVPADAPAYLHTLTHFLAPKEKSSTKAWLGLLAMAFMFTYMLTAPSSAGWPSACCAG